MSLYQEYIEAKKNLHLKDLSIEVDKKVEDAINDKDKIVIVSGSLKKDHNIFEKIEGDYQKFTIEIDESSTSKKIEGELKKVIKKEDQVIKIEMLQPSMAA